MIRITDNRYMKKSGRRTISASTLMETLVAGVLFMTVFLITMSAATSIMSVPNAGDLLEMERGFSLCLKEYLNDNPEHEKHEYKYDWGTISICETQYSENIRSVDMTADMNGGQTVTYTVLIPSGESEAL